MITDIWMSQSGTSKVGTVLNTLKTWKDSKTRLIKKLSHLDKLRGHKFITKAILDKAEKVWKQEDKTDPKILVKYFSPSMTWYITEIEIDNPTQAFGYVKNEAYWEWEFWYINLEELSIARFNSWLPGIKMPVERDLFFRKWKTMNEALWINKNNINLNLINVWDKLKYRDNKWKIYKWKVEWFEPLNTDLPYHKVKINNFITTIEDLKQLYKEWVSEKNFTDGLIFILDDKINWEAKYENHCLFYHNEDTNNFEIVWKFSDNQPNWDNVILSHKDLTPEEKKWTDEEISETFFKKLNEKL